MWREWRQWWNQHGQRVTRSGSQQEGGACLLAQYSEGGTEALDNFVRITWERWVREEEAERRNTARQRREHEDARKNEQAEAIAWREAVPYRA